ncbi:hypothetical protein FJV41_18130 [Myxococcus llanfairpwllgwyngyllgogerychwyrndrobwllllantysiliogogogochensis]|uniref:Inner membrane protein n=1 Tax=Myxococcus llanfairpwllgwyngyllgogerychwyrndrobwllllantysiliogogogochensis TaxID=2590453 RepID=A0A540WZY0_9BACT|nr:hypothetical protein [Myxococcus llanfairpwllgwyngyllgogerychwyrndrobwllllantysiliogogogochensis]TQF14567.1 hypothetical protein FJV41_18130 [Myxococcus llanfairpwllgwyngyllgogerychwyrndrobwllllantysiliogogogochensis]
MNIPVSAPRPQRTSDGPIRRAFRWLVAHHVFGSLFIVIFATAVIAGQVADRADFANSELAAGVEDRWGAPVVQPAPSLRFVHSGTIFTELKPLAFDRQHVEVLAKMNYRKRGLRYFSGFDFNLGAEYAVVNREGHDIDVAFIFPMEMDKSQVLLSELQFLVDGQEASLDLGDSGNRLVWTGRIAKGATARFVIRYRARGLDSFIYKLDPALSARDVRLHFAVEGGDNYDYPGGVLSASSVQTGSDTVTLDWAFQSLESGVNLGVILPSEKTFDSMVSRMASRAWVPFLALVALLAALGMRHKRQLALHEAYLLAAVYGFFFVLLAYLAAFMNFYGAYVLSALGLGAAVVAYARWLFPKERMAVLAGLWAATLLVPTGAVILEGYTGLIYTLEILAGLLGLMVLSTRSSVRAFLSDLSQPGAAPREAAATPVTPEAS